MTNGQKAGLLLLAIFAAGAGFIYGGVSIKKWEDARVAKISAPTEPRVIKIKEVVGQVVGGPMVATGSGKFVYAVYVRELDGVACLDAAKCPLLDRGERVVMYKGSSRSEWHTFLRLAER